MALAFWILLVDFRAKSAKTPKSHLKHILDFHKNKMQRLLKMSLGYLCGFLA